MGIRSLEDMLITLGDCSEAQGFSISMIVFRLPTVYGEDGFGRDVIVGHLQPNMTPHFACRAFRLHYKDLAKLISDKFGESYEANPIDTI